MTDIELLSAAIDASSLTARQFAIDVLGVEDRTIRRWLDESRDVPSTVKILSAAIVRRPAIVQEIMDAHASIIGAPETAIAP